MKAEIGRSWRIRIGKIVIDIPRFRPIQWLRGERTLFSRPGTNAGRAETYHRRPTRQP